MRQYSTIETAICAGMAQHALAAPGGAEQMAKQAWDRLMTQGEAGKVGFMLASILGPQLARSGASLTSSLSLAMLAAPIPLPAAAGRAQLLPASDFPTRDGRPGPGRRFKVDDMSGRTLADAINATASLTPVLIDYDHATLSAEAKGKPAPAAGWIKSAQWETGRGLFANVEWTPAAERMIRDGEYRYMSPVISYDKSDRIIAVPLAALTNFPAILGMAPVMAPQLQRAGAP